VDCLLAMLDGQRPESRVLATSLKVRASTCAAIPSSGALPVAPAR
jgi:hypothetical protein